MLRTVTTASNRTTGKAALNRGVPTLRRKLPDSCNLSSLSSWHQSQLQQQQGENNRPPGYLRPSSLWSPTGNGRTLLQRLNYYNSRFYSPYNVPVSISLLERRQSSNLIDDAKKCIQQTHPLISKDMFSPRFFVEPKVTGVRINGVISTRQQSLRTLSTYHQPPIYTRGNGIRWLTSNSKQGEKEANKNAEESIPESQTPQELEKLEQKTAENDAMKAGEASPGTDGTGGPTRLTTFVDSVGPTLKRVSEEWNAGDLLSVYGIVALIGVIAVAPFVVRHMRRSDSTYEDLDPEDPVTDMARIVRDEFLRTSSAFEMLSGNGDGQQERHGSTLGIDSILAELLKSKQVQDAITGLVTKVIESPEFKRACQVLLRELWNDLVQDPETLSQVVHLLQHAIKDERIKEAAIELVMDVVNDKEVMEELTALLQKLGSEEKVQAATQSLLVESAHNALNDPEILDHSMEFATDVVGDDAVQRTAGEALYNTLSYAVRPTLSVLLSVMGAGLIVLSVAAFRNANATEEQMDRAMSATMSMIESGNVLSKIASIPFQILTACKDAVVYVVTFPHRLLTRVLTVIGQTGTATKDTVNNAIRWFINLPGGVAKYILNLLRQGSNAILGRISDKSRQTWSAISTSITTSTFGVMVASIANIIGDTYTMLVLSFNSIGATFSKLSSTMDKVDDKLNAWGFAVEMFLSKVVETIRNVYYSNVVVGSGGGGGGGSNSLRRHFSSSSTATINTLNRAGEQLSEFLTKMLDVLATSLSAMTKR